MEPPTSVKVAATVLYVQSAIAVITGVLFLAGQAVLLALIVLGGAVLQIWLTAMIWRGRYWARAIVTALICLGVLALLLQLDATSVVGILVNLVVLALLWTEKSKEYFYAVRYLRSRDG